MNNTKRGFFLCEVLHSISASDVRRGVFVYIPSLVRDNQLRKAPYLLSCSLGIEVGGLKNSVRTRTEVQEVLGG